MAKAAPPKREKLSRKAVKLVVCLGDEDGNAPTSADEIDYLHPIRIERSAGGGRVDSVILAYDLSANNQHIVDTLAPKGLTRQCEVREIDTVTGTVSRVLMWGKLASEPTQIDGGNESITFVVRLDRHHISTVMSRVSYYDKEADAVIYLNKPLVFNPEIDETIHANRSDKRDAANDNMYLMFDAGGPNTAAARTTHGQVPTKWLIYEAVHHLCWTLNANEANVKNPTFEEVRTALRDLDFIYERLKNLSIPKGVYLSQALDMLLTPFGGGWYVAYEYDSENDLSIRRLKCFIRNAGTERELFLQRPGEQLKTSRSNVPSLSINYDIANLANKIVAHSSLKQREVTIELYKGWPTSQDSYTRENLLTNSATKLAAPHAHCKWVANEHGGWTDLRAEITTALSFAGLFGSDDVLVTARKCLPCISRHADSASNTLESRGIFVEWYNPDSAAWEPVTWSHSKLEQEIGIYFDQPPQELVDLCQAEPSTARLRVTCTIEGDTCNEQIATRQTTSPNANNVPFLLDLKDKFHDRGLVTTGALTTRFASESATADIRDDSAALLQFAKDVRDKEDAADLSCSAVLEGLDHPEWAIGFLVRSVNGRNLKLNRNNPEAGVTPKYLQVMGETFDVQGQRTELLLESFDEEQT
jgi:hypothetical protein